MQRCCSISGKGLNMYLVLQTCIDRSPWLYPHMCLRWHIFSLFFFSFSGIFTGDLVVYFKMWIKYPTPTVHLKRKSPVYTLQIKQFVCFMEKYSPYSELVGPVQKIFLNIRSWTLQIKAKKDFLLLLVSELFFVGGGVFIF